MRIVPPANLRKKHDFSKIEYEDLVIPNKMGVMAVAGNILLILKIICSIPPVIKIGQYMVVFFHQLRLQFWNTIRRETPCLKQN
jgi:hypothetical protein